VCFGFDLYVERFIHLGYDLDYGDEDERKGGRDEEDVHGWDFLSNRELHLRQEKGDHFYMVALVTTSPSSVG
jgi:surfactin synthase thioesterase subunit